MAGGHPYGVGIGIAVMGGMCYNRVILIIRGMDMKRITAVILLLFLLTGCGMQEYVPVVTGPHITTPTATTAPKPVLPTAPAMRNGWLEEDGQRFFYVQDMPLTGWQQLDSHWYYFGENGAMHTGFLEDEGKTYFFRENGTMATGEVIIDGTPCHFTSQGKRVIMVNPWNYVPADYAPDLVSLTSAHGVQGSLVDSSCYEALTAMIDDCNKVCPQAYVVSSYRTHQQQVDNYNRKVRYYMDQGYGEETAKKEAATIIAIPGTSEHQLGLAVDFILQKMPVQRVFTAPLAPLAKLGAHKGELIARMGHHVGVESAGTGKFDGIISGHFSEEGGLAVHHLVVREGQNVIFGKGVEQ